MTPTEEMAYAGWSREYREDPNLEEAETRLGYPAFIPRDNQQLSTQIWVPLTDDDMPPTQRASLRCEVEEYPYDEEEDTDGEEEEWASQEDPCIQMTVEGKKIT